jgi:hypothetical protein
MNTYISVFILFIGGNGCSLYQEMTVIFKKNQINGAAIIIILDMIIIFGFYTKYITYKFIMSLNIWQIHFLLGYLHIHP